MTRDVRLEFTRRAPEAIEADIVVVGFFSEDRPLRGAAGRLDWRLCGQLSEFLSSGWLEGRLGSAALLPGSGPIAAMRVLLLGLGTRREFTLERAREVMHDAVGRCLALGAQSVALSPLGIAPDDFARHSEVLIEGLSQAVREAIPDQNEEDMSDLVLRISLGEKQLHDANQVLPSLIASCADPRIRLSGEGVPPSPSRSPRTPSGDEPRSRILHPDPN